MSRVKNKSNGEKCAADFPVSPPLNLSCFLENHFCFLSLSPSPPISSQYNNHFAVALLNRSYLYTNYEIVTNE